QRTDRVSLDLVAHLEQQIDLPLLRIADRHPLEHAPHPSRAFTARRALAAAFMLVEVRDPGNRANDVGRLVHHDDRSSAETGLRLAQAVEVHEQVAAHLGRKARHRRTAGNDRKKVVPAAAHAACMAVEQFAERDPHLILDAAPRAHVTGDAEQLGAGVVGPPQTGEPGRAAPEDFRYDRNALDVVHRGGRAIQPYVRREWRLQAWQPLLALEAFQQRRLLAADVGAGTMLNVYVEIPVELVVLAEETSLVGFVYGGFQHLALADELAADVDVADVGAHRETGDQATLDEQVRVVPHDVAVLARAGFGLIRVDDQVMRPPV